jgi:putative hydrolase of the HAD superfamily
MSRGPRSAVRGPRLRAIAFDLWETLISNTVEQSRQHERLRLERMERILREQGYGGAADQIDMAYQRVWHRCQELYWASDRDISCRTQIDHFLEALELEISDEATRDALEQAYARVAVEVLPSTVDGAAEVLAEVKRRGFRVGLISNTGRTPGYALREILDRLGLAPFIDSMVFSNEHGECKPRQSIFEALRKSLGVRFDEMLFVGDNLYVDVHGAQQCGMRAVHFAPDQRGTAVAPPVDHGHEIEPDATIKDLRELPHMIDGFSAPRYGSERTHRS